MVDKRGTEIAIGEVVAYNLSGMVAIGEVVYLKEGKKNQWGAYFWQDRPIIKIQADEQWKNHAGKGGISNVRDPYSLVVLL